MLVREKIPVYELEKLDVLTTTKLVSNPNTPEAKVAIVQFVLCKELKFAAHPGVPSLVRVWRLIVNKVPAPRF